MRGFGCRSWNNNEDRGRGRQVMIRRLMLTEERGSEKRGGESQRKRERERRGEGPILEQRTTRRRGNKDLFNIMLLLSGWRIRV